MKSESLFGHFFPRVDVMVGSSEVDIAVVECCAVLELHQCHGNNGPRGPRETLAVFLRRFLELSCIPECRCTVQRRPKFTKEHIEEK